MKKYLFALGVALASAFTLTNCTEEIQTVPEVENTPYTIYADAAETKTANDGLSTVWVAGDALNVFHAPAGSSEYGANTEFTLSDAEKGIFTTDALQGKLEDVNDWYVIYPYDERIVTPAATNEGFIDIAAKVHTTQKGYGLKSHLAGRLCPLYGVAKGVSDKTIPSITMNHLTSVACVEVTNNSEEDLVISSVTFTAPEAICGTFYIDVTGEQPTYVCSGENYVSNTATVKVDNNGFSIGPGERTDIFVVIKPFTAKEGSELKIAVNGSEKVKVMDKDVMFAPGKIKTLKFSYEEVAEPMDIAEVIAGGAGANVMTEGLVVATYAKGFILEDATGRILVYENETPSAAIGDRVVVSGSTSVYREFLQIVSSGVEVMSSGNPVNYPEPKVLDAAGMEKQLEATSIEYIQYTGSFEISSGKYYNVYVDGTTASVGSLIYPLESFDLADLDGKAVTVTGYNIGVNATKYLNTMAVSVEEVIETDESLPLEGRQLSFELWGGPAVIDISFTTPGKLYVVPYDDESEGYYYTGWDVYDYEIVSSDATSGVIRLAGLIPGGGSFGYEEDVNITYTDYEGSSLKISSWYYELEDAPATVLADEVVLKSYDMPEYTVDGKQWVIKNVNMLIDLGYTESGVMYFAKKGKDAAGNTVWQKEFQCGYQVDKKDGGSGFILTEEGILFEYSELTERTVRIVESNRYKFDEFADDKTGTVKL